MRIARALRSTAIQGPEVKEIQEQERIRELLGYSESE
jgi:hypothetical protein